MRYRDIVSLFHIQVALNCYQGRWFHFGKEQTVNVTNANICTAKFRATEAEFCSTNVGELSH